MKIIQVLMLQTRNHNLVDINLTGETSVTCHLSENIQYGSLRNWWNSFQKTDVPPMYHHVIMLCYYIKYCNFNNISKHDNKVKKMK